MASGISAVPAWSWAGDGGRRGGHAAVVVNDGDEVYLYDLHTGRQHVYDRQTQQFTGYWGQEAVATMAVGFLHVDGDAVIPLDGSPGELVAADQVGWVQGHSGPVTLAGLREREREVIALLAAGLTVARSPSECLLPRSRHGSPRSRYVGAGLHRREELVVMAYESGVVNPEDAAPLAVVSQERLDRLTERDWVVWRLVGQGLTNGDIAAALSFSERSVRSWVSNLAASWVRRLVRSWW